jgi:hypothetical protein
MSLVYYGDAAARRAEYDEVAKFGRATHAYISMRARESQLPPGVEQALLEEAKAAIPTRDDYRVNFSLPTCIERELRRLRAVHADDDETLDAITMMQAREQPHELARQLDRLARAARNHEVQMRMVWREVQLEAKRLGLVWDGSDFVPRGIVGGIPNRYRR